jgi:hypothetical protein
MAAKVLGLLGATIREIGILVFVFAPLESYLRGPDPPMISVRRLVVGALILMAAGITLEVTVEKET